MPATILRTETGSYCTNCYIVYDKNNVGVIIDPGDEAEEIERLVKAYGLDIKAILLTHGHCDHLMAAAPLQEKYAYPLYVHRDDAKMVEECVLQGRIIGLRCAKAPRVDHYLQESEPLTFGGLSFRFLHTPGHTPGGVVILCGNDAFCGDTIFRGSVGRTDLPGSSQRALFDSICAKVYTLPESVVLHPGHGPDTTVQYEKRNNPFVRP